MQGLVDYIACVLSQQIVYRSISPYNEKLWVTSEQVIPCKASGSGKSITKNGYGM